MTKRCFNRLKMRFKHLTEIIQGVRHVTQRGNLLGIREILKLKLLGNKVQDPNRLHMLLIHMLLMENQLRLKRSDYYLY